MHHESTLFVIILKNVVVEANSCPHEKCTIVVKFGGCIRGFFGSEEGHREKEIRSVIIHRRNKKPLITRPIMFIPVSPPELVASYLFDRSRYPKV